MVRMDIRFLGEERGMRDGVGREERGAEESESESELEVEEVGEGGAEEEWWRL